MKRLVHPQHVFRGEITAMTAFLFLLMLSIVGALMQSAFLQYQKSEDRVRTQMALESVFAEYHLELLEKYEIFARHGSEEVFQNRLAYYGADGIQHRVVKVEYLSDDGGLPFYQQVVRYMKEWKGISESPLEKGIEFQEDTITKEEHTILEELHSVWEEMEENHPIRYIQNLKKSSLLQLVGADSEQLSNRALSLDETASHRELQKGALTMKQEEGAADRVLFQTYVREYFHNYHTEESTHALAYEQEYLLGGFASDRENLEAVCKKIIALRMVTNYVYLASNEQRRQEAEIMATATSVLLQIPVPIEILQQGILLAWSYGESIIDMRMLLKGKCIPYVKTDENWQLQLSNLNKLGSEEEVVVEKEDEKGISYELFLYSLLILENKKTVSMRCLDLIEKNLNIKVDECYYAVEIQSTSKETFTTIFGYQ